MDHKKKIQELLKKKKGEKAVESIQDWQEKEMPEYDSEDKDPNSKKWMKSRLYKLIKHKTDK